MPRDKRNQNSEPIFGQNHVVFGCLQFWVFNPQLELSTAVKCTPVLIMCHLLFISRKIEADSGTHSRQPISLLIALNVAREILQ
jgi:hypothetical protein